MGRWHNFMSSEPLEPLDNYTLDKIKNYLRTQRSEFRMNIEDYFNDKDLFSKNRIILASGIIYDVEEPMEFQTSTHYGTNLYFKCGEGKYFEITFIILCILKGYYGEKVVYNTDVNKHFFAKPLYVLQSMGYTINFKSKVHQEGVYWEEEEEIIVSLN